MSTPNLDATGHRWVAALAGYNFKLEYVKGTANRVADALSHQEKRLTAEETEEIMHSLPPPAAAERIVLQEEDVQALLGGLMTGTSDRAEAYAPAVQSAAEEMLQSVEAGPRVKHMRY